MPFDSVLLVGFGGPTRSEEIRPFLDNVLRGRPVPRERYEEVVHHYEEIGGYSPYNPYTFRQAQALGKHLERNGSVLPVYVGLRNWSPYIRDAIEQMVQEGRQAAVGFILAPHRSEASWERYRTEVEQARKDLGSPSPVVAYLDPWHDHPGFLAAAAAQVREVFPSKARDGKDRTALIFTAHSIPQAMADRSSYVAEIHASSAGVASRLGMADWSVAYQSRSGNPRDPWLEPDVNDAIRQKAREGFHRIILVPIGFLCDHVEVLYDLDREARATAREAGIRLLRAPTVGDHPAFIAMIAQLIRQKQKAAKA